MDVKVFGDGSNNMIEFSIKDAVYEHIWGVAAEVDWTGWRTVGLPVDGSWCHIDSPEDDCHDGYLPRSPVSEVGVGVSEHASGAKSGRIFVDEIALTFPQAGRRVINSFEDELLHLQLTMLGEPQTTVVFGEGFDWQDRTVPFAMARREAVDTAFAALFEPYGQAPRITGFEALPVSPARDARAAFRITAPGHFRDTLLFTDDDGQGDRTFGEFTTDGAVAYVRQDPAGRLQTLVVADADHLEDPSRSLIESTVPVTVEVSYAGALIELTLLEVPEAELRIYAPEARLATVNGTLAPARRDGAYLLVTLPPDPDRCYLPVAARVR
jgi:hypothetical protein